MTSTGKLQSAIDWIRDRLPAQISGRTQRITVAAFSALLGKIVMILVSIITVPITVRYLGPDRYGIWITISTTIAMFLVLDIGISSTLTNLISEAYAKDDRHLAAEYFSTAFWSLIGIVMILGICAAGLWHFVQWKYVFNLRSAALAHETSLAMVAAFVVFLVSLPTGLVVKVLAGYQELHIANFFAAGGSVLSLLVVLLVVSLHGGLPMLVGGYAGAAVSANLVCLLWVCLVHKPWIKPLPRRVNLRYFRRIFGSGTQFFAIQIAGLVVFSTDNLIISHYLSPAQVTPYSITWRLVNYIAIAQTFLFPALWPAYSEAYANGQLDWIRRTYGRVRKLTILLLVAGCSLMVFAGRTIIRIWAGPAAIPSETLVCLMCVWIIIYAVTTNQSCLMGATFRTGKQATVAVLAAALNLTLSIVWVRPMGTSGVLLATVVSYLVFIVAVQTHEVRRILRGDFLLKHIPATSNITSAE
jgi:O-antigen/teichoic acid export membrane protein